MTARTHLLPALLKRELDVLLGAVALACAMGALLIAREIAAAGIDATPPGLAIIVRRPDLTLLFVMAIATMLRIAARTEADRVAAWAAAPCAAGGGRLWYGPGVALSTFAAAAIVYVAGAIAFAVGVRVFGDTSELLHALPITLTGGTLVLASFSLYTAILGVLLKRSYATMFFAVALLIVPYVLTLPYLRQDAPLPRWLYLWLISYPPPLGLPSNVRAFIHGSGYVLCGIIVLAAASHRYAVRHT